MELRQRWCDNATCRDYGKVGAGNIKVWLYRTTAFLVRRRRQRDRWRRWLGGSADDLAERLPATGPTPPPGKVTETGASSAPPSGAVIVTVAWPIGPAQSAPVRRTYETGTRSDATAPGLSGWS